MSFKLNVVMLIVAHDAFMLSVIMPNVIMMGIMVPPHRHLETSRSTSLNQSRVLKGHYDTQHNNNQHNNK